MMDNCFKTIDSLSKEFKVLRSEMSQYETSSNKNNSVERKPKGFNHVRTTTAYTGSNHHQQLFSSVSQNTSYRENLPNGQSGSKPYSNSKLDLTSKILRNPNNKTCDFDSENFREFGSRAGLGTLRKELKF